MLKQNHLSRNFTFMQSIKAGVDVLKLNRVGQQLIYWKLAGVVHVDETWDVASRHAAALVGALHRFLHGAEGNGRDAELMIGMR